MTSWLPAMLILCHRLKPILKTMILKKMLVSTQNHRSITFRSCLSQQLMTNLIQLTQMRVITALVATGLLLSPAKGSRRMIVSTVPLRLLVFGNSRSKNHRTMTQKMRSLMTIQIFLAIPTIPSTIATQATSTLTQVDYLTSIPSHSTTISLNGSSRLTFLAE